MTQFIFFDPIFPLFFKGVVLKKFHLQNRFIKIDSVIKIQVAILVSYSPRTKRVEIGYDRSII